MQQRHIDRRQYFNELANTSRKYYIDYLKPYIDITPETRILEIGCGEGGNLLPFAELGCYVKGIDLNAKQIENAKTFFAENGQKGDFVAEDFLNYTPLNNCPTGRESYNIILIHDCIEHIEPPYKDAFFKKTMDFLHPDGIMFFGFPAWQMPFGGHQQICVGKISKIPFIHLLPNPLYRGLLNLSKEEQGRIDELMSIKRSKMPVEKFEKLANDNHFEIVHKQYWFINPHYEQKFNLKPRKLGKILSHIPYFRNFFTTSAFYLLKKKI